MNSQNQNAIWIGCQLDESTYAILSSSAQRRSIIAKFAWEIGCPPPTLKPHSAAKLRLVEHYLDSYFDAVLQNPRIDKLRITLVDGFSGGGAFTDGLNTVDGTPFLLLKAVERATHRLNAGKAKPLVIDADFHFIDSKKRTTDYLKDQLLHKGYINRLGRDIHVHTKKFEATAPEILDAIAQRSNRGAGRSLFLLDQKGYTKAPLATIRNIFDRFKRAECILTFAVDWLIDYLSERPENLAAAANVELSLDQVREFVRMRGEEGGRYAIQRLLLDHLRDRAGAAFATAFFIRSTEAKKALWLIHLSQHATARNVMVDSHWSVTNHSIHQGKGGLDIVGFDPSSFDPTTFMFAEHERALMLQTLADDIARRVRNTHGSAPVEYGRFVDSVVNQTPARLSDIDAAVGSLISANALSVLNPLQRSKRSQKVSRTDFIEISRQARLF